jgi:hypothetical protein
MEGRLLSIGELTQSQPNFFPASALDWRAAQALDSRLTYVSVTAPNLLRSSREEQMLLTFVHTALYA